MNPRRLYRSADDRILAGVCGGVAAYFDVDPVIVRIIWFLSVFFTGSLTFWAYLIMIVVVPIEPAEWPPQSPWAPGGAPVGGACAPPRRAGPRSRTPASSPSRPVFPVPANACQHPGCVSPAVSAHGDHDVTRSGDSLGREPAASRPAARRCPGAGPAR